MIPPVSLPLTGGTQSARADPQTSTPIIAVSKAAPSNRIVISIVASRTLERQAGHEKNGKPADLDLRLGVAAPHLTLFGLRGTVTVSDHRRISHAQPHHILEESRFRRRARRGSGAVRRPAAGARRQSAGAEFRSVWAGL